MSREQEEKYRMAVNDALFAAIEAFEALASSLAKSGVLTTNSRDNLRKSLSSLRDSLDDAVEIDSLMRSEEDE